MESTKKSHPTENTPRNRHQPSDREHLETAREKPHPTRWPILARFHRYRVCGNRPGSALALSTNDECYTYAQTATDKLNSPCTQPGTTREVNEARLPHTCSRLCAFEERKKKEKSAQPKTYHEIHIIPATAWNSRLHAMEHVPRVSPKYPDSIDPGFLEIGLVQLSQSVKTRMLHTDAHTYRQTN